MSGTRTFPLRVVLTVTTGRLLTCPSDGGNGIGDLYEIIDHMTGVGGVTTLTLGVGSKSCKRVLEKKFPELRRVNSDTLRIPEGAGRPEAQRLIMEWLDAEQRRCGLQSVYQIPLGCLD